MTTISLAKLRLNLSDIIKELVKKNKRFVLEKDEIPVGVLLNYQDYKHLIEQLEDFALICNPDVTKRIEQAKNERKRGKVKPFEELIKELDI